MSGSHLRRTKHKAGESWHNKGWLYWVLCINRLQRGASSVTWKLTCDERFLREVRVKDPLTREQVWWPPGFLPPLAALDWILSFQDSISSSVDERAELDNPVAFSDCGTLQLKDICACVPSQYFLPNRIHYNTICILVMDTQNVRGRKNFIVSIYLNFVLCMGFFKPLSLLLNDVTPNK